MAPIPDANFYDDASSDGTSVELIAVNDQDDIDDEEEEFDMPIDGMFIMSLMGLTIAPGAIPGMLGSDGAGVIESDADSDATEEGNEAPFMVPRLLAASVGRFQPFPYPLIPRGHGNEVIDTSIHHYHDNVIIERRRPTRWGLGADFLDQPGLLKTEIYLEAFDPESVNRADCDYRFFHLRVFVLIFGHRRRADRDGSKILFTIVSLFILCS